MAAPGPSPGERLGHYRLLEQIGAGGMGVVFRARDERLERDVAIKVLPPGTLSEEAARKRFRKEALALSRLNHPNIATVHDFDSEGGLDFLVTELVAGLTLSDKLMDGPLPEKQVTELGIQLADGLSAAHVAGIVHRDLKPGNLRLTPEGRLKVLDFGLAKVLAEPNDLTASDLTQPNAAPGTLPYMAPEQLRGEMVDERADIWAAGATLYEIATGRRPFVGSTVAMLALAIVNEKPPAPRGLNDRISPALEQVILKCLEKDPKNRTQSAKELLADLQRLTAGGTPSSSVVPATPRPRPKRLGRRKRIQSLVVLPLTNLSRDPEQEYFADGMTEALISDLAKLRALRVISRTSAMRYKGSEKSLPEIAEELNVDGVVEGSVLRIGQRVRITVQLVHAATDTHLWAENYDRDVQDVLLLQSEAARAIAQEIKIAVSPDEAKRLASAQRVNTEAYEAYLKGRFHWYKLSREHLDAALEYFQLALAKDPNYALAYAGTAWVWFSRGDTGLVPAHEAFPKVEAAALKAMALDHSLAEVHEVLAALKTWEWDWEGAEVAFRRAIELNPSYADAHFMYADLLISLGRPQAWEAESKRALELDPLNFFLQCFFGWHLIYQGRYDEAIAQLHKTLAQEPGFSSAHMGLWGAFYKKEMYEEALSQAKTFFTVLGDHELNHVLQDGSTETGYRRAMKQAGNILAARSARTHVPAVRVARLYAHAGEPARTLEWLEKAYDRRETPLGHLAVAWDWGDLHRHPQFQDLLRRVKLSR